ncbi:MAG TPA: ATP-dependent DNA ligase [Acidisarcina sp.]|nr:ATP-dependent DNA ligase [Acidisarcina sp.]
MAAGFLEFAELSEALAETSSKLQKRSRIADWLRTLSPEDAALAALYLAGQPFAETDRRALNLGGSLLTRAVMQLTGASTQALHATYLGHGDLGSAASDLMQPEPENAVLPRLTLSDVDATLGAIAEARGASVKLRILVPLLARMTPLEAKYLIKLALGDMRTGVRQSLIEEAIAAAFVARVAEVRRAVMLVGDLGEVVGMAATRRLRDARMRLFHPLGFMLASPVATVEEAMQRFAAEVKRECAGTEGAEEEESERIVAKGKQPQADMEAQIGTQDQVPVPAPVQAQVEDKYDGIRCQLHCGEEGRVVLFSRTREELTASFPEIVTAFVTIPQPVILDGEILAWDPVNGRARPFASLQTRVGRKRVSLSMQRETPVVFMAFDVLYFRGELTLEEPLWKRRRMLEEFVCEYRERTTVGAGDAGNCDQPLLFAMPLEDNAFPRLMLSPSGILNSAEQLEQAYMDARTRGNEGVMIKSRNSVYQPGRRGLAWLKMKRELATLDVVVTAVEFGHGRRANVLSDYTFAVRDGERLRNVGKAYSGLTDSEIEDLTVFFREHTLEDFGRIRSVEPLIVLEVAFNNVMRSERHDSGFALRFPRILRLRTDKPVAEIDSLQRVEEIYASQPDRPAG